MCELKNMKGAVLKTKVNVNRLKVYKYPDEHKESNVDMDAKSEKNEGTDARSEENEESDAKSEGGSDEENGKEGAANEDNEGADANHEEKGGEGGSKEENGNECASNEVNGTEGASNEENEGSDEDHETKNTESNKTVTETSAALPIHITHIHINAVQTVNQNKPNELLHGQCKKSKRVKTVPLKLEAKVDDVQQSLYCENVKKTRHGIQTSDLETDTKETISYICDDALHILQKNWKSLTSSQRNSINSNVMYIARVICTNCSSMPTVLCAVGSEVFMQNQGNTALCGLCALNNAYQAEVFDVVSLNRAADELWIKQSTDLHLPITESYTPMRDARGWYSIEVLIHAVQCHGDRMFCLSNVLIQCLKDCRHDELLNCLNPSKIFPCKFLIRVPKKAHFTILLCRSSEDIILLDSLKCRPISLNSTKLPDIFGEMHHDQMFALYGFKLNQVETKSTVSFKNEALSTHNFQEQQGITRI